MKIMKKLALILSALTVLFSCAKEQKMELQQFAVPGSEEEQAAKADYYAALRAYKASDHVLSYVYMGRYATLEGAANLNVEYKTLEHRFLALPDSLDIVNLWMGAPYPTDHSEYCWYKDGEPDYQFDFSPQCYEDMQYCRRVKGTKFVLHADASKNYPEFDLIDYDENGKPMYDDEGNLKKTHWKLNKNKKETHEAYAEFLYRKCLEYNIDGLDFDYEGWLEKQINWTTAYLEKKMGPNADPDSPGKDLLLIIDYFGVVPPEESIARCNYIVNQAYSVQSGLSTNGNLANGHPDKWILVEQWEQGDPLNYTQGGKRWSDPSTNELGEDLYSLEAYALYCKNGGAKGFGAYYIDNDYKYSVTTKRGTFPTYGYLRNAIRAANPISGNNTPEE